MGLLLRFADADYRCGSAIATYQEWSYRERMKKPLYWLFLICVGLGFHWLFGFTWPQSVFCAFLYAVLFYAGVGSLIGLAEMSERKG